MTARAGAGITPAIADKDDEMLKNEAVSIGNGSYGLSVVIPAYNEEATIGTILERVSRLENLEEIIVVDDGSKDATVARVKAFAHPKVRLVQMARNGGKTAAIRRGLQEVEGDITIFQDADLEYDPAEIGDVIRPILEDKADAVYGSRFLVRRATRVLYYRHYLANKLLTALSNLLTNVNMTDIETCYKAFRTPLIKQLPLTTSGFGMEVEITALVTKTKARIYEVPISYYGRTYEEGKKIKLKDGLAALWYICYCNLSCRTSPTKRRYIQEADTFLTRWRESAQRPAWRLSDRDTAYIGERSM